MIKIKIKTTEPMNLVALLHYDNHSKEVGLKEKEVDGVSYFDGVLSIDSLRNYLCGVNNIEVFVYANDRLNKYPDKVEIFINDDHIQTISFRYDKDATHCYYLLNYDLETEKIILKGNYSSLADLRDKLSIC